MISAVSSYLDSNKLLRLALLCVGLVTASISLYMGAAIYLLVFRGDNLLIVVLLLVAVLLNYAMGWIVHRRSGRGIFAAIMLTSGVTVAGAVLTSIVVWRGHWLEVVKEIFSHISMMR